MYISTSYLTLWEFMKLNGFNSHQNIRIEYSDRPQYKTFVYVNIIYFIPTHIFLTFLFFQ